MSAARELLMIVIESAYGTPKSTPSLGTDKCYMRLDQGNSFVMEAEPIQSSIPFGGGFNVEADTVSDIVQCKGNFNFLLFPGIWTTLLLPWAIVPVNAGRTLPWTTTDSAGVMPAGDMASLSFYHAYLEEDGATYRRTRYAGVKCDTWQLAATETGDGRMFRFSGTCTGIKPLGNPWDAGATDPDATEFPAPADTDYPFGPYTLGHLGSGGTGTITFGSGAGTNRAAEVVSFTMKGTNRFAGNYYTNRFIHTYRWLGRQTSADMVLRFRVSPDDRALWRALTATTLTAKLDNGTHTAQLAYHGNNLVRPWAKDLNPQQEYQQRMTVVNRWDGSASTDLTLTLT